MPSVKFEPTISAGEWPKTYALDRAATGTGCMEHVSLGKKKASSIYDSTYAWRNNIYSGVTRVAK
jgi:hypothetical protein